MMQPEWSRRIAQAKNAMMLEGPGDDLVAFLEKVDALVSRATQYDSENGAPEDILRWVARYAPPEQVREAAPFAFLMERR